MNVHKTIPYAAITRHITPMIDERMIRELTRPLQKDKFLEVVRQMQPDKSPGPDSFNLAFYQNFWSMVGTDLFNSCKKWRSDGLFLKGLTLNMWY